MYEEREPGFWAKCWVDEQISLPSVPEGPTRQLAVVPAHGDSTGRQVSGAVERYHHLGGMASYAALGVRFEPAGVGQLSIRVPSAASGEWFEQASFGLTEARQTLARELGPGHLTLTHLHGDEVDSSPAAFATTATALAFVLTRSELEVSSTSESFLRLPCRFEMTVERASRLPESIRKRSGVMGVALAGPYLKGDLRVGDQINIAGDTPMLGRVAGFPMLNFGAERRNWISVEVDDINEFEPAAGTLATGPGHWRRREEQ